MWIIDRVRIVDVQGLTFYDVSAEQLHALERMGAPPAPLPCCPGLQLEFDWRWIKPPWYRRVLSYLGTFCGGRGHE